MTRKTKRINCDMTDKSIAVVTSRSHREHAVINVEGKEVALSGNGIDELIKALECAKRALE